MHGSGKLAIAITVAALIVCLGGCANKTSPTEEAVVSSDAVTTDSAGAMVLARSMTRIDGSMQDLNEYQGKVVLVVNVASKCGLTPQYEGLQDLYESKRGEGFVILAFPANNFGGQEPGSNSEITAFCTENYGVTFPMFSKISVTGEDQDPLFATLSAQTKDPSWNFTKYLIDRDGQLVERFDPRTSPDDETLVGKIDELLNAD